VETFGRVVFEAMACGLPVVCHRHGGYADWIASGENGFLFSTDDEARNILDQLIANPSLRRSVGANARQTIEGMYAGDKMEERLQFYVCSKPLPDSLRLGEDREKARSCNLLRLWHLTIPSLLPANKNDQPLDGAVIMPPRSAGMPPYANPCRRQDREFTTRSIQPRTRAPSRHNRSRPAPGGCSMGGEPFTRAARGAERDRPTAQQGSIPGRSSRSRPRSASAHPLCIRDCIRPAQP